MARNTLIVVAAVLALIGTVFFAKARHVLIPLQSAATGARSPSTALSFTQTSPKNPGERIPAVEGLPTNSTVMRRELEQQVQALKASLLEKQRLIAAKAQQVQAIQQASNQSPSRADAANSVSADPADSVSADPAEVDSRIDEVESLSAHLDEVRASREDVRAREEASVRMREANSRSALAQVDANLQELQEATAKTQQQLDRWTADHAPINSVGTVTHNPDLEATLTQQKQQIEDLRQQRLSVLASEQQQTEAIYSLGQQAREDLRTQEQDTRRQIFSLQSDIRRIQRAQIHERMSHQTQDSQASLQQRAERELQAEQQQLKALESSLQSKQADLRRLE